MIGPLARNYETNQRGKSAPQVSAIQGRDGESRRFGHERRQSPRDLRRLSVCFFRPGDRKGFVARKPRERSKQVRRPETYKGHLTRINAEGLKALRQFALDRGSTAQALAIEALNNLSANTVAGQSPRALVPGGECRVLRRRLPWWRM
jgi:hypothetical protein